MAEAGMTSDPSSHEIADIAIIGGGINGCGIARDAAGRGLKVKLFEADDLAWATSSASTKLIHGGLRYLEYYEFRLVREALIEREVLLRSAPHIIRPLNFILPHHDGLRPAWMIRLGLFLYDHLGPRKLLPGSRRLSLRREQAGTVLKPQYGLGFSYADCRVDDSRLTVLTAMDARARGAEIHTRCKVLQGSRENGHWLLRVLDRRRDREFDLRARLVINAAGPWVSEVLENRLGQTQHKPVRLVKGSHIIVRRALASAIGEDTAFIFQNGDGRIVFTIPYGETLTLIGTTDLDYEGDPGQCAISAEETRYLLDAVNDYLAEPLGPADICGSYAGVRPLYDDGASSAQAATRDYVLDLDTAAGAPLLTVYGGKITTFRRLAEHALEKIAPIFPQMGRAWTASATLPGGDLAVDGVQALAEELRQRCPSCSPGRALRLARLYGTRARMIISGVKAADDWGQDFGGDLTEREVRYLMTEEWARSAGDVAWRRTKQGYWMSEEQMLALDLWMTQRALAEA